MRAVLSKESPVGLARSVVEHDDPPTRCGHDGRPRLAGTDVPEVDQRHRARHDRSRILAEELGRVIAPGPLLPTITQFVPAVREVGTARTTPPLLGRSPRVMPGSLAIAERRVVRPARTTTVASRATRNAAGEKRFVMRATRVDELVVCRSTASRRGAVVVPVRDVTTTRARVRRQPPPRARHLDGVGAHDRLLGDRDARRAGARAAVEEATVASRSRWSGTAQTIFGHHTRLAKQREQFGVPIGSFQAIKHKFADMCLRSSGRARLGYFAALTIAEDDDAARPRRRSRKAAAGDCQRLLAKEGIQIHGGIGYTWEHDMHLYVKRIKSGEQLFGTSSAHRARIAELSASS
jgi:alkylation response protein AidB-like acyl-CoA dehydrogenase